MKSTRIFFLLSFILISVYALAQNNIEGVWKSDKGDYMIKISSMGQEYQARIVWMENEKDANGQLKLDEKNPEEKFRKLPIKGSKIITNLEYKSGSNWQNGKLYIPDEGKIYDCDASISGNKLIINYTSNGGQKTWSWIRQN